MVLKGFGINFVHYLPLTILRLRRAKVLAL